jgi:hypothetical protein
MEKSNNEPIQKVEVNICYINILADFLEVLKKDDYKALRENGYEFEYQNGFLQEWVDDMQTDLSKLIDFDHDAEIVLEKVKGNV